MNNWKNATLKDVAQWGAGGTPSRSNKTYYTGDIPWIKSGELKSKYLQFTEEKITKEAVENSSAKLFPKGSVAIAMYGATIGKTSILAIDATCNQAVAVAKPAKEITADFLYYYLCSIEKDLISFGQGGAQPNISQQILKKIPIKYPSIDEQCRITVKIENLFSKVDKGTSELENSLTKLSLYKLAVLNSAIQGKLTNQDSKDKPVSNLLNLIHQEKEKHSNEKKAKKDTFLKPINKDEIPFDLPSCWAWARLGDVVTLKNGYAFKSNYYCKKQTKHILTTPGHFNEEGGFRDQKAKTKFYNGPIPEGFILESGDLIVAMTEQAAGLLGSAAFIPNDEFSYLHNQRLAKITPNGEILCKKYISLYFNSSYLRENLASTCTGSTVRHTSPDRILNNLIPIPPLNEQKRIVKLVDQLMAQIQTLSFVVQENSVKSRKLKQSILRKAFEGEL